MTTVEILFRYASQPSEATSRALAGARDVYGIRRLTFDRASHLLRVEYDATRLNAATVARLLRQAGLTIVKEMPLAAPPPPEPAAAPAA
jgi:hypothetical protein